MNDLFFGFADFRHRVSPSGKVRAGTASQPSAGALASSGASASCYGTSKNIGVLAIVEPKGKFFQIERQVFLTDVVIAAHNTAFQKRPEILNAVRMNLAANIFALAVLYDLVRIQLAQFAIGRMLVSRQGDVGDTVW